MRTAAPICLILGTMFFSAADSYADASSVRTNYERTRAVNAAETMAAPRQVCDWVGPGGRAVYRCNTTDQAPGGR
jgi:hypothetical protein